MPLFIAKPSKESLFRRISGWIRSGVAIAVVASLSLSLQARVLDNFNDNTKTGWTDFTFVPGFGLPTEVGGQFQFQQTVSPSGGSIFSASQKTSRVFNLAEGERVSYSVDVVQGGAKDSFAILAFIPTANSPGTLGGYGLAKSTTDILITKGINKYFVAEDGPAANLKQNNITLNLNLTVRGGSVFIHARVLDKDANNAVIWEKTVVDSAAADVLVAGKDDPAAPYITAGYSTKALRKAHIKPSMTTPLSPRPRCKSTWPPSFLSSLPASLLIFCRRVPPCPSRRPMTHHSAMTVWRWCSMAPATPRPMG
jgi:hypothetical protein